MARWTHAVCDPCWEAQEPAALPVRLARPRIDYCGWCAQRTESGIYRRADPAEVPYAESPADARAYIHMFRRFTLPGTAYVDTTNKRRITLDRMTDSDALFVAGEFRRMEIEAARRAASRGAPARRLGLS